MSPSGHCLFRDMCVNDIRPKIVDFLPQVSSAISKSCPGNKCFLSIGQWRSRELLASMHIVTRQVAAGQRPLVYAYLVLMPRSIRLVNWCVNLF